MFGPSYQAGCPVKSSIVDTFDGLRLHAAVAAVEVRHFRAGLRGRPVTIVLGVAAAVALDYSMFRGWHVAVRPGWVSTQRGWADHRGHDQRLAGCGAAAGSGPPRVKPLVEQSAGDGATRRMWLRSPGVADSRLIPPGRRFGACLRLGVCRTY